jgi:hypothetical protein
MMRPPVLSITGNSNTLDGQGQYQMLDTGCWILDAAVYAVLRRAKGYWMRVSFTPRRQAAKILSARLCEVFDLLA